MKEAINEMWGLVPMKARYSLFFMLGLLFLGTVWLTSCTGVAGFIKNLPQDSVDEEISEQVVEGYLGLPEGTLDFTPNSEEDEDE